MSNKRKIFMSVFLAIGFLLGTAFVFANADVVELKPIGQPEMVAALGINGNEGYLLSKDIDNLPYTAKGITVPVYEKDGKTAIDSFLVGGCDPKQPVVAYFIHAEKGIMVLYGDVHMTLSEFTEKAKNDKLSEDYIQSVYMQSKKIVEKNLNYSNNRIATEGNAVPDTVKSMVSVLERELFLIDEMSK